MSDCKHDKCYAPYVLTSYPAQYPWVCRKCRATGVDRGACADGAEYHRLLRENADSAPDSAANALYTAQSEVNRYPAIASRRRVFE